jgi:hypothetical protein
MLGLDEGKWNMRMRMRMRMKIVRIQRTGSNSRLGREWKNGRDMDRRLDVNDIQVDERGLNHPIYGDDHVLLNLDLALLLPHLKVTVMVETSYKSQAVSSITTFSTRCDEYTTTFI